MTPAPPPPPPTDELDPLTYDWPAERPFVRVYRSPRDVGAFWHGAAPGVAPTRFGPILDGTGSPVPLLYAGDTLLSALAESVFHDVPVGGTNKRVFFASLKRRLAGAVAPTRALKLIDLTSTGLHRLRVPRTTLIESGSTHYADTAAWAHALHAHPGNFDGMLWVSRQEDTTRAVVLWGDRIADRELPQIPLPPQDGGGDATAASWPLDSGPGLEAVLTQAQRAGITVIGVPKPAPTSATATVTAGASLQAPPP
ncbi:RES domain-containing protein [Cellulomonas sp. URHE0023]|uniref:RES domain-containing protein n=1 Tax=Cellulomonas sp. URHE0023 TaxID=1380354 RepID=UPI00068CB50A|nr:RES domain-containing protein [Cellulomonas sp. URHE0023]